MSEAAQRIVHYSVRDGIAVITLNNPPVNSLGNALRAAIMEYLKKAEGDPAVKGAVLIGSAKAFSGGADIREFNKPREKPDLAELNEQQAPITQPPGAATPGVRRGRGPGRRRARRSRPPLAAGGPARASATPRVPPSPR